MTEWENVEWNVPDTQAQTMILALRQKAAAGDCDHLMQAIKTNTACECSQDVVPENVERTGGHVRERRVR